VTAERLITLPTKVYFSAFTAVFMATNITPPYAPAGVAEFPPTHSAPPHVFAALTDILVANITPIHGSALIAEVLVALITCFDANCIWLTSSIRAGFAQWSVGVLAWRPFFQSAPYTTEHQMRRKGENLKAFGTFESTVETLANSAFFPHYAVGAHTIFTFLAERGVTLAFGAWVITYWTIA
jgi:hypothetical protein